MAYWEVRVVEICLILTLWLRGGGKKSIGLRVGMDPKTVRRYVERATSLGLRRDGGVEQLSDDFLNAMALSLQPGKSGPRGESWQLCDEQRDKIEHWLNTDKLKLTKVQTLLTRCTGEEVPYRTLHRFAAEEFGFRQRKTTMRVDDCAPGAELQVDFGRMGFIREPDSIEKRVVWALIFTAVFSRHSFVWLSHRQTVGDVIAGFEAAWKFFGGVFDVVIPDNLKAIVIAADPLNPRLNEAFLEYAKSRDFTPDPCRVRSPKDKPRVERAVPFVRESFFKGEVFLGLADAQQRAETWCLTTAGLRDHGTTHQAPLVVFNTQEKPALKALPEQPYDLPTYDDVKVHRDQHFCIGGALYSMPEHLVGQKVHVRVDSHMVRVYDRGALVRTHPRQPKGGRRSDPADFSEHKMIYATRDVDALLRMAAEAGPAVSTYAQRLSEMPAPWRQMRAIYSLLGLVRRYGAAPVDRACAAALQLDVVDVTRIGRMVKLALENDPQHVPPNPLPANVIRGRFARPASHFSVPRPH